MRDLSRRDALALLGGALAAIGLPAWAQGRYPDRPIRLVVPFPAGQGADILARLIAEQLASKLGQPVVVDNKPGAGGIIGTAAAARSPSDGYTLYMGSSGPLAIGPHVYKSPGFDPLKDFAPITNVASVTQVLVTAGNSPITSLKDFIEQARAKPDVLMFASAGNGATNRLTMELLCQMSGISLTHVPYKGSPAAMVDVMAGRIPVMFDAMPGILSNVKAGKLRALAVSSPQRSPLLPDVPTVAESGVPGFATIGWIGLLAPAGASSQIVDRIAKEVTGILRTEDARKKLRELAFTPIGDTPAEFGAFLSAELALWRDVAAKAGVEKE